MTLLMSTEQLAAELNDPTLRVVDATLVAEADGRDLRAEFEAAHIPGAVFLELATLVDASSGLPNMLPSPEKFASRMQSLGIGDGSRIILYDDSPWHTSARAWWMLKVFGAHYVSLLDGGIAKWRSEGRPLESGLPVVRHRHFTVWADRTRVRDFDQMRSNLVSRAEQVVDARSAARFAGLEPELRPGVRAGHIPGSLNLPYDQLFRPDGTWKQGDDLRQAFVDAGVDPERPVITTCNSGITAAVLAFGLALLGKEHVSLYDGSWSEWGANATAPVVTGGVGAETQATPERIG